MLLRNTMRCSFFFNILLISHCVNMEDTPEETASSDLSSLIELMKITNKTCGTIDWCSVKTGTSLTNAPGCCPKCSCETNCITQRDCCPDFLLAKQLGGVWYTNMDNLDDAMKNITLNDSIVLDMGYNNMDTTTTKCLPSQMFNLHYRTPRVPLYEMVAKCPDTHTEEYIRLKCEEPFSDPENVSLIDLIPVQTINDGRVFRNKYCLSCNIITHTVLHNSFMWDVYLSCINFPTSVLRSPIPTSDILMRLLIHDQIENMQRVFELRFVPSRSESKYIPTQCVETNVDVCSTGNASMLNKEIVCTKHLLPVHTYIDGDTVVFRNLQCLTCNGYDVIKNYKLCSVFNYWDNEPSLAKINSDLIQNNGEYDEKPHHVMIKSFSRECKSGHVFDELLNQCRKIYCPCGLTLHLGKCIPIVTEIPKMAYELNIVASINDPVKEEDENDLFTGYFALFLDIFKANSSFKIVSMDLAKIRIQSDQFKDYAINLVFRGTSFTTVFGKALSFIGDNLRGPKQIQTSNMTYMVSLKISDSLQRHGSKIVDTVKGHGYEIVQDLRPPNRSLNETLNPSDRERILIPECYFCYMIKLFPDEFQFMSRNHLKLKRNQMLFAFSKHNFLDTGILVCADQLLGKSIWQTIPTDDIITHESTREEKSSSINGIVLLITIASLALVLSAMFYISRKLECMKFM